MNQRARARTGNFLIIKSPGAADAPGRLLLTIRKVHTLIPVIMKSKM